MQIVVAGHVDHGKSTVLGRLLADTGSLPEGRMERVRATCERHAKPFEYAFLLDALKDEQAQGITIDAARVFFRSPRREYLILDAPGHIEFLKNMVTGASHAEAALLVIDAQEGVRENSRRHGYMLSMLGISHLAVLVNKMDLVDYDEAVFRDVVAEYTAFLASLGVTPASVLPVSGRHGENVVAPPTKMPWFTGPTVLEALDAFPEAEVPEAQPLRLPVQGVYRFTRGGDARRIVAGTIESGSIGPGDGIAFYPSGKRSRVRSLESFGRPAPDRAGVGEPVGFTLEEQVYIPRGEIVTRTDEQRPEVSTRLRASVFWLGRTPLVPGHEYRMKLGAAKVPMEVERIERVLDASTLGEDETRTRVERHEVAEVVLRLRAPLAFDRAETLSATGRFVIVDDHDIRGGGIVREALEDEHAAMRERVFLRNLRWETSRVGARERAARYQQRAALLLLTGPVGGRRKEIAKALEQRLFLDGRVVYYLGFGSVLHGLDADLARAAGDSATAELMRRLAEVAYILLDAGVILVVTAQDLVRADLDVFRTVVGTEQIQVVWAGARRTTDLPVDLDVGEAEEAEALARILAHLDEQGVVPTASGSDEPA